MLGAFAEVWTAKDFLVHHWAAQRCGHIPETGGDSGSGGGGGSGSGSAGADPGPTISRADALAKLAEAYSLLYASVFVPGQSYLFCCAQPRYCPTVYPGDRGRRWGSAFRPDQLPSGPTIVRTHYNSSVLRRAWELLVEAVPACGGSANSAITYDPLRPAACGRG
eukprot:COSAG01_NODE_14794_length_1409_cov_1.172519_2_plen_165_part_00